MFFEFRHNYYDHKGRNFAHCEILGGWIDLGARKLIPLQEEMMLLFNKVERPKDFRILTKEDTRKHQKAPVHLEDTGNS